MSNSPLVNYTRISPNRSKRRQSKIDTVTIHCVVGQLSVEVLGAGFARSERKASSNYGIGPDGRIGMYVEEKDRSWCSSNWQNDDRAITIEVASDTKEPYAVTDAAYNALIDLLVDVCQRNGIKKLLWKNDKSLIGQVDKQNMTVHRWFAAKSCPGEYLFSRHGQIADAVNARLLGTGSSSDSENTEETNNNETEKNESTDTNDQKAPFTVTVAISDLAIRKGPGENYDKTGRVTGKGVFTIVEVKDGWGKLKSGAGWIPLSLKNPDNASEVKPNEDTKDSKTDYSDYTKISGRAVATIDQMIARLKTANPNVPQSVIDMIPYYISEGETEGIRGDVAFAQSCIETGNFTFPSSTCAVTIEQNNFAMMGVTSTYAKGETFETPQLGIRAQIQHLKAYATTEPLVGECVDPRFSYVIRGCAPYVEWLGMQENPQGKGWASGKDYGPKILRVLNEILNTKVEDSSEKAEETENKTSTNSDNNLKAPFTVTVAISDLAIRKGPGENYDKTGRVTGKGVFTIVEVKDGWGKLKSGAGWIPLSLKNPVSPNTNIEKKDEAKPTNDLKLPFKVKVDISYLNIRKGPGMNYDKTGSKTGIGTFTIVEVSEGEGSSTGWGKLKSGAGWICLDYTKKV